MKLNTEYALKCTDNGTVVVLKADDKPLEGNIVLNDTAKYLWHLLENGVTSKEQLLHKLLEKFDISTVLALSEIDIFLKTLKENGIIEL